MGGGNIRLLSTQATPANTYQALVGGDVGTFERVSSSRVITIIVRYRAVMPFARDGQ